MKGSFPSQYYVPKIIIIYATTLHTHEKSNKFNDFYLLCSAFAYPYGTFAFELQNSLYYDKEKNQNRKQQIANKNAVE